jgi:DNA repair protein RadC
MTATPSSMFDQLLLSRTEPARPRALAERPLTEWPAGERPAERLATLGPRALSDSELLSILFGATRTRNPVALAESLLADHGGWAGLTQQSVPALARLPGMTARSAAIVVALGEISRRLSVMERLDRAQVRSPADAARLIMAAIGHHDQEHLVTLLLDTKNRVIKLHTVYIGTLNSSAVRMGEVFKEAVRVNAAALILGHNHPSQDVTPSPEDVLVTRQIVEAGKLLDVELLDHVVCSATRYTSLRERGLGFSKEH